MAAPRKYPDGCVSGRPGWRSSCGLTHPDVAVQHESGLTLTVLPRWRLVVEDVESDLGPFWVDVTDRSAVVAAMQEVSVGSLDLLDRITTWAPGYPPS